MVEHFLAKEDVAGSNPVSRSPSATSPSGKARLCKSCISGSNPLVASRRDVFFYRVSFFVISQDNPSMREQRSYSTESVILKHSDLGEADRIITLFTPYKGKFHAELSYDELETFELVAQDVLKKLGYPVFTPLTNTALISEGAIAAYDVINGHLKKEILLNARPADLEKREGQLAIVSDIKQSAFRYSAE